MINLEELASAPHTIATKNGRMRVSSLRPGDWLGTAEFPVLVTINSAKLQLIVLRWYGIAKSAPLTYEEISHSDFKCIGHGKRRAWFKLLPKWIAKHVCEFGRPT